MSGKSWAFFALSVICLNALAYLPLEGIKLIAGLICVNYFALLAILFKEPK